MTRKLERSPLYGVDCHESMGAPLNDHLSDISRRRLTVCVPLRFQGLLFIGIPLALFRPEAT